MNCIFIKNGKQIKQKALRIQRKTLLNMKIVANYLNFGFHIELNTKSKYKILNFVFQFIKNMEWHFGYKD